MRERLVNRVDEDQADIAGLEFAERRIDGQEFNVDFLDFPRPPCILESVAQQGKHFAVGAAALAGILIEDDTVKGISQDFSLPADILVTPFTGAADDDNTAAPRRRRYIANGIDQRLNGVGIMAVVGGNRCGGSAVALPDVQ